MKSKISKSVKTSRKDPKGGRGQLGGLYGHSVAAVIRTLGKQGLKSPQVLGIMHALVIKVNPHTVHLQVGAGRNGNMSYGKPAELTKKQLAELLRKAPALNNN